MTSTITRDDTRYPILRRGKNARFPSTTSDEVARVEVCETAEDVANALQRAVHAGLRPTVRSGGHCYEDFVVNNPNGVLLDVGMLDRTGAAPDGRHGYQVGPGTMLGVAYNELFRKYNVTLPGGSCYSVAAGGHLSGGGYGLLTRLQGMSVDLITAIDILTVDAGGTVIPRHVNRTNCPDLFRALRGSGGASYGVITNFYFEHLPAPPRQLSSAGVSFPWDTMTEEKFIQIAQTYGHYHETRGQQEDTWPMFTMMGLTHRTPNGRIGISATWHDMDGTNNLSVPTEFLDLFLKCGDPVQDVAPPVNSHAGVTQARVPEQQSPCIAGKHRFVTSPWIDATVGGGGAGVNGNTRGKYKSCYMKKNFTVAELKQMYAWLTRDIPGVNTNCIIAVDSYGGAANNRKMGSETSIPQRSSVMKLQYQMYWQDATEDAARLHYFDQMYTEIYSANVHGKYAGTPFHDENYEGCYINYPDQDMVRYTFWPELYYGQDGLYPFLQAVKKKYDPNNIFHNSMAVRA